MKHKPFLVGTALCAYLLTPIAFIVQKSTLDNQLATTLTHEADRHGNNNGQLELAEIRDVYQRMGINPNALTMKPYARLITSGDPTLKNKPFDFRFPIESDLERGIRSYR